MKIQRVEFAEFRNYGRFELGDVGDLTILVGRNAIGKTNVLEGIQLLTSASSFRRPLLSQLVRDGAPEPRARLVMEAGDGNRLVKTELMLEPGKKRYLVNGKAKGGADVRGLLPSVMFTPDDLALAKKSSSVKRDALDELGSQLNRSYYIVRRDYEKTVRYKNRLLKDEADPLLVESIDETLIACGARLYCLRRALFERMLPIVSANYAAIAGISGDGAPAAPPPHAPTATAADVATALAVPSPRASTATAADVAIPPVGTPLRASAVPAEVFTAMYVPSWEKLAGDIGEGAAARATAADSATFTPSEIRVKMAAELERFRGEERRRRRALVGPHNDQIAFLLAGRDASAFASQGQQRSVVLAWKMAEVAVTREILGISPVLLLDDVLSELDATRREMLVGFVTEDIQTFVTATDLSGFDHGLVDRARIVDLEKRGT